MQVNSRVRCPARPELGVGIILEITSDGDVQVGFGTQTLWCVAEQLQRHYWEDGARVFCSGLRKPGVVTRRRERSGIALYDVFVDGQTRSFPEHQLEETGAVAPLIRLATHPPEDWDTGLDIELKLQATRLQFAYAHDPTACLSAARLEPLPHQVFVSHRVIQEAFPRYILADEPGLGKTIEAGMVIKELRARGLVHRVLIIAPASLVTQWQWELENKFNERFTVYDSLRLQTLRQDIGEDDNPWNIHPRIITSLQFVRQEQRALEVAECDWDLVVFDEAHHLRRQQEGPGRVRNTLAYHLGADLASRAEGLLLLTATPMQLNSFELFSLVNLVDPSLCSTYEAFARYQSEIPILNQALQVVDGAAAAPHLAERLRGLLRELGDAGGAPVEPGELREWLLERHLLTRVMLRNRKRVIGGFADREAMTITVQLTPAEEQIYGEIQNYVRMAYDFAQRENNLALQFTMVTFQRLLASSSHALERSIRRRVAALRENRASELSEDDAAQFEEDLEELPDEVLGGPTLADEIGQLEAFARQVAQVGTDSKAEKLEQLLQELLKNPSEKVLVFTQFRDTQTYLARRLGDRYSVVNFHGGMSREEKDEAARQFRRSVQIMISTEAGGEGRNFQFCHFLINYDLPWNPMKVEQRIGRLDRIGQEHKVFVYNFSISGTVEDRVFQVLTERIRLFERNIGALDPILGELEADIRRIILKHGRDFHREVEILTRRLEDQIRDAVAVEEKMADFIMDRHSFRNDTYLELLDRKPSYTGAHLCSFIHSLINRYDPGAVQEVEKGVDFIRLPQRLRQALADSQLHPEYRGTFDLEIARQREDVPFLAFGHPLVDHLVAFAHSADFPGTAGFRCAALPQYSGFVGVQWNFVLEFDGVEQHRQLVPVLVGMDGGYDEERSEAIAAAPSTQTDLLPPPVDPELWSRLEERAEVILYQRAEVEAAARQQENDRRYAAHWVKLQSFKRAKLALLAQRRDATQALLDEKASSTDARTRRILPALRGKVARTEADMHEAAAGFDRRMAELEQRRRVTYSVSNLSTVLVRVI